MAEDGARLLGTFLEAVTVDSPSGNEGDFARWCAGRLSSLGCDVLIDATGEEVGSDTGNLIAELAATAPGRTIVLSAHLDTVEPGRGISPVVEDGVVRSSGDTVLGSDDKAGVAVILETFEWLVESGTPHGKVRALLTTCEEKGLRGARALEERYLDGDLCLVLDAGGPVGGIVVASSTHYTFSAVFHGVASHAGIEPERGRSAIRMAATAIERMPYGRIDRHTTANVGSIEGGGATNVVAASCTLTGECRSIDPGRVESVRTAMDSAMTEAAREHGGSVDIRWHKEYEGQSHASDSEAVTTVENACRTAGIEPYRFTTGGGSDANILAAKGLPTVALASGMTDVHGVEENIAVSELEAMARLVRTLIEGAVDR